jgi:hypothetical protein
MRNFIIAVVVLIVCIFLLAGCGTLGKRDPKIVYMLPEIPAELKVPPQPLKPILPYTTELGVVPDVPETK